MLFRSCKKYTDDAFDSLNINFNVTRPVDTNSLMEDLKMQQEMDAISKRTIIEQSPYTTDVALELERIQAEKETESVNDNTTKETGGNTNG